MAVNLSPYGGVGAQFLDNSGNVLTGGKIYTYGAGTTTPQVTYTTSAGSTPHSNPIILDAAGRVPSGGEIWLTDGLSYKFILRDANDVLIATYDNISGINSNFVAFTNQQEIQTATAGQTVFNLTTMSYQPGTNNLSVFVDGVNQYGPGAQYAYLETDSDTVTFVNGLHVGAEVKFTTSQLNSSGLQANAFQVSYTPPFTGSVGTNVGDKLAQTVSVKDFGADSTGATDSTTAIQSALNSGAKSIYAPAGTYLISTTLTIPSNVHFFGDTLGYGSYISTVIKYSGGAVAIQIGNGAGTGYYSKVSQLTIKNSGTGTIGIYLRATQTEVENVTIMPFGSTGFSDSGIKTDYTGTTFTHLIRRVYVYGCANGLYLRTVNNVIIDACFLESNGTNIYLQDASNIVISNGTVLELFGDLPRGAETATSCCIDANNVKNLVVRDYYAEVAANAVAAIGQQFARLTSVSGGCIESGYIYTDGGNNSITYPLIEIKDSATTNVGIKNNNFSRMGLDAYAVGVSGTGVLANNDIGGNKVTVNSYEYNNTWTPTLLIGGSAIGITYSVQQGLWWRNGSNVTVSGTIVLTSKGANSGVVTIGNLPINMQPRLSSSMYIAGSLFMANINNQNTAQSMSRITTSASTIRLQYRLTGANNDTAYLDTDLSNTSAIYFSISYPVQN